MIDLATYRALFDHARTQTTDVTPAEDDTSVTGRRDSRGAVPRPGPVWPVNEAGDRTPTRLPTPGAQRPDNGALTGSDPSN